jgi:hypothetical protein
MSANSSSEFETPVRTSGIGFRLKAGFVIMLAVNSLVLAYFHNRFWWPPDEGAYAHTAERILAGEALNAQVEEIHPGYVTFVNAAAFKLFGLKLVSLRYPLVVAALIQSCLLFLMLARRDVTLAVVAGVSAVALGVIQFLNPTPNWYCLLFATLSAFVLSRSSQQPWRVIAVGFLIGLTFLFRQITGVFLGIAVLTYLLTETREPTPVRANLLARETLLARGLLLLMALGLTGYLGRATDAYGLVLFGVWPIVFLVLAAFLVSTSNRRAVTIVATMGAGFLAACLPIVLYHLVHGSLRVFVDDTLLRALHVSKFSYLKIASYGTLQIQGVKNALAFQSIATTVNGIYWLLLPLSAIALGVITVRAFKNAQTSGAIGPLPVVAIFYGLVALLQQIPIYLSYALPLTVAALLWFALRARKPWKLVVAVLTLCFSFIAIYYHAAQPVTRTLAGIIRGDRVPFVARSTIERSGLLTDAQSMTVYTDLIRIIQQVSPPNDSILVIPNNPEIYFLAGRKNPFRFWNSAIGIRDEKEAAEVLQILANAPPRTIVLSPDDRNNTAAAAPIVNYVGNHYVLVTTIAQFEVYRGPITVRLAPSE